MKIINTFLVIFAVTLLCSCNKNLPKTEEITEVLSIDDQDLKVLIAEAAATDFEIMTDISELGYVDPVFLKEEYGETLTYRMIVSTIQPSKPGEKMFVELSQNMKPADLAHALNEPSAGSVCSILYPEYITELEWKSDREKITGHFTFQATNKAYKGKAGFVAVVDSGHDKGLFVSSFILESEGVRIDRKDLKSMWESSPISDKK